MSDNRALITIEFHIFGEEFKTEMNINYFPSDDGGTDHRIVDWFSDCYERAKMKFDAEVEAGEREQRKAEEERAERAELARLKAKYDRGTP